MHNDELTPVKQSQLMIIMFYTAKEKETLNALY